MFKDKGVRIAARNFLGTLAVCLGLLVGCDACPDIVSGMRVDLSRSVSDQMGYKEVCETNGVCCYQVSTHLALSCVATKITIITEENRAKPTDYDSYFEDGEGTRVLGQGVSARPRCVLDGASCPDSR